MGSTQRHGKKDHIPHSSIGHTEETQDGEKMDKRVQPLEKYKVKIGIIFKYLKKKYKHFRHTTIYKGTNLW